MQIAQKWLQKLPVERGKEAVVFFNDSDELCIIDRNGLVEQFQTSPYAEQLDRCLVILRQAHARATNLMLPNKHYRAAVTLGANLSKDALVQGKWISHQIRRD
jgi:hypothetical protein